MILSNAHGLTYRFLNTGTIQSIQSDKILINLKEGNPYDVTGTQFYLRKRSEKKIFTALLGVNSPSKFTINDKLFKAKGSWNNINYCISLQLSDTSKSWYWQIDLQTDTNHPDTYDIIYVQEIGLKNVGKDLINEYYVSQYVERIVIQDQKFGAVVGCRQNMKQPTGNPWVLLASTSKSIAASTDGKQFYGNSYRATGIPESLQNDVLQGNLAGEHSVVALQSDLFNFSIDKSKQIGFIGTFLPNHSKATTTDDLKLLPKIVDEFNTITLNNDSIIWKDPESNIFQSTNFLEVEDLTENDIIKYFGNTKQHIEKQDGALLSFFTQKSTHVVLKQKELLTDRPHAHILQANVDFTPNQNTMSTTCFATGIFNSHLTQGNTNFNILLSVNTSSFNLNIHSGQRVFVILNNKHYLLGIPSAFEMGLNFCRWLYKFNNNCIEIVTQTSFQNPVIEFNINVLSEQNLSFIITHDFDTTNTWKIIKTDVDTYNITPQKDCMLYEKFPNANFKLTISQNKNIKDSFLTNINSDETIQSNYLFVLETTDIKYFKTQFTGQLLKEFNNNTTIFNNDNFYWNQLKNGLQLHAEDININAFQNILPWYGLNAMIHYLTPYGLEQFGGAAWGTRDVSQGPIELLLSLEKYEAARTILLTIFKNQNPKGDWPQWWMFDDYSHIRASDCHGDIYYWVIIALAQYITTTGDYDILNQKLPFFGEDAKVFTIAEHIDRLIKMITDSYVAGTALVPFGGGDWNDSLQPVNEQLAQRLISSWTVEMNYQAFVAYSEIFEKSGEIQKFEELKKWTEKIKCDFNKFLVINDIVAGYGYIQDNGEISVLLHPNDTITGINYSLLPMNRGIISGIFTKKQALFHQNIIDTYLKGPDGTRLMNKPLTYKGGIQQIFQRAESSPYFGREIGLMYIHEHIRYAESQAVLGKADAFVKALRQAIPIDYKAIVPNSNIRQSNCYYTSSDVQFATRYEADQKYNDVLEGKITLNGGWRVYSSGPGIYISLIIKKLLGFRVYYNQIILDPVLTKNMNGLKANFNYNGYFLEFHFEVNNQEFHPKSIKINDNTISFKIEENPYRLGGAIISKTVFEQHLNSEKNTIYIKL